MVESAIEKEFIEEIAGLFAVQVSDLSRDTRFIEDLGASSARMFAVSGVMEELGGFDVSYSEANGCSTIGDAIDFIKARSA